MRVLLIPPKNNYPNPEPDTTSFGQGMAYLAGELKTAGHEVFGINMNYIWCHGSAPLTLERLLQEAISKYSPQLIGIGGLAPDYYFIRDAIFFIRKISPGIPVVLGGGIVTYDPDFIFSLLRPDFAVMSEGEIGIVKLAECLGKNGELDSVPSLVYNKDSNTVFNSIKYHENLDDIAFPEYEPFDFESYLTLNNQTNNFLAHTRQFPRILPLTMGRSCPFKCTFCCHGKGASYRSRSIDNVIREIAHFYEKYKFNILYLHDELFLGQKAREFCAGVKMLKKQMKADFDWGCYLRVNDADEDLLREMKDSGCRYIGYGFESASETILKSMKKGATVKQMRNALELTQKVNIGFHANFIFGDPAETPKTIKETVDFYNARCRYLPVFFYHITPYPGSEIFQYCLDKKLITDKRRYYETVAFRKGGLNMTSMGDEEFNKLTQPAMSDIFDNKLAKILSFDKSDVPTCDSEAPFELRRTFYRIKAVCPYCSSEIEYLYPLRKDKSGLVRPFIHFCPNCHKKLTVDLSRENSQEADDSYSNFYREKPYTEYYPFDSTNHAMPSVPTPQLLESHKAYNIIRYANYIYAIAQALGPLDLTSLGNSHLDEYLKRGKCFIGDSVDEIKKLVDEKVKAR